MKNVFCGQITSLPSLTGSGVAVVVSTLDSDFVQNKPPDTSNLNSGSIMPIIRKVNKKPDDLVVEYRRRMNVQVALPDFICVETRFITQAAAAHAQIELLPPTPLSMSLPFTPLSTQQSPNIMPSPLQSTQMMPTMATTTNTPLMASQRVALSSTKQTSNAPLTPFSAVPKSKDESMTQKQVTPQPMVYLGNSKTNVSNYQQGIKKSSTLPNTYSTMSNNYSTMSNNYSIVNHPTTPYISTPNKLLSAAGRAVCVDSCTNTDAPHPTRERGLQTDFKTPILIDAATQCCLEKEELEKEYECCIGNEQTENIDGAKMKADFMKFVKENTYTYPNGKQECLVCGEIESNEKDMQTHLALHWGPTALCYRCGIEFENENFMNAHKCEMKMKKRSTAALSNSCGRNLENKIPMKSQKCEKKYKKRSTVGHDLSLKCPHYRCGVVAISQLELYDHINEHMDMQLYRCSGCERVFHTAGELRHHLPMRLKCLEALKQRLPYHIGKTKNDRKYRVRVFNVHATRNRRALVKTFLTLITKTKGISKKHRCQICLKICTNKFQFSRHTQRCVKSYLSRYKRKRYNYGTVSN